MAGPTCSTPVATPPQGTAAPPVTSGAGPLRHLTKPPLGEAEADQGGGETVEGFEDVGPALVAHGDPPEASEPSERTLDHPPVPPEVASALDPAPGDPGDDPAPPAGAAAAAVVVAL